MADLGDGRVTAEGATDVTQGHPLAMEVDEAARDASGSAAAQLQRGSPRPWMAGSGRSATKLGSGPAGIASVLFDPAEGSIQLEAASKWSIAPAKSLSTNGFCSNAPAA
jgi:hypothetical protein